MVKKTLLLFAWKDDEGRTLVQCDQIWWSLTKIGFKSGFSACYAAASSFWACCQISCNTRMKSEWKRRAMVNRAGISKCLNWRIYLGISNFPALSKVEHFINRRISGLVLKKKMVKEKSLMLDELGNCNEFPNEKYAISKTYHPLCKNKAGFRWRPNLT